QPRLISFAQVARGDASRGYSTPKTVTEPASRFTVTTIESSGETATADPWLEPGSTDVDVTACADSIASSSSSENDLVPSARHPAAPSSDGTAASDVKTTNRNADLMRTPPRADGVRRTDMAASAGGIASD